MAQRANGANMDTFADFDSSKLFEQVRCLLTIWHIYGYGLSFIFKFKYIRRNLCSFVSDNKCRCRKSKYFYKIAITFSLFLLQLYQVPIKIYCSPYTEALLLGHVAKRKEGTAIDGITLQSKGESHEESAAGKGLERNVALLLETVEEFTLQQRETQMYERAQRQNKMNANQRVPKSIDALNLTKQIQEHSSNLDSYCVNTFAKLYLGGEGKADAPELAAMKNLMN